MMNIFPNSYYKITEGKILDNKNKNNMNDSNINNHRKESINNQTNEESSKEDLTREYSEDIQKDKSQTQDNYKAKEKVYFLRIFRRFVKTGTLYSSALVYNTITDSINFCFIIYINFFRTRFNFINIKFIFCLFIIFFTFFNFTIFLIFYFY